MTKKPNIRKDVSKNEEGIKPKDRNRSVSVTRPWRGVVDKEGKREQGKKKHRNGFACVVM